MIFSDINIFSILFFIILLLSIWYIFIRLFIQGFHRKQMLIIMSIFVLLLVSTLWPKWTMQSTTSTTTWSNIAFVVDVSKSMDALDFENQSMSRLSMVKNIISNYIVSQPTGRYALDAFSGEAVKLLPFTGDTSIYQTSLLWIDQSNVGKGWTDIIKALYSSISHFTEDQKGGLIVLFTDGWEDKVENLEAIESVLDEKAITVLIVWIGSKKGSYIPVWTDFFGRTIYKTYEWKKVLTKLNDDVLNNLAKSIWKYVEIDSSSDIWWLFSEIDDLSEKVSFENDTEQRKNLVWLYMMIWFLLWIAFLWNMLFAKYRKK